MECFIVIVVRSGQIDLSENMFKNSCNRSSSSWGHRMCICALVSPGGKIKLNWTYLRSGWKKELSSRLHHEDGQVYSVVQPVLHVRKSMLKNTPSSFPSVSGLSFSMIWLLGCSENCIFHDRNYPECFSIPLYIIKTGKLKQIGKISVPPFGQK